jgi:hypothetical protein
LEQDSQNDSLKAQKYGSKYKGGDARQSRYDKHLKPIFSMMVSVKAFSDWA